MKTPTLCLTRDLARANRVAKHAFRTGLAPAMLRSGDFYLVFIVTGD